MFWWDLQVAKEVIWEELGGEFLTALSSQFPLPPPPPPFFFLHPIDNSAHFRKLIWVFGSDWLDWASWIWAPSEYESKAGKSCVESFSMWCVERFRKSSFHFYLEESWLARNYVFRTCKQSIYLPASTWGSEFQWKHLFVC